MIWEGLDARDKGMGMCIREGGGGGGNRTFFSLRAFCKARKASTGRFRSTRTILSIMFFSKTLN